MVTLLLGSGLAFAARMRHVHPTAAEGGPYGGVARARQAPLTSPTTGGAGHTPTSTPSASTSPHASGTAAGAPPDPVSRNTPKATASGSAPSTSRITKAYLTGYSYFDNTPPGSADISHPILHTTAGGTGTYADPITVAVGHSLTGAGDVLDWTAGTRFYVPNLRKYFVAEDTCGDGPDPQAGPCHVGYPAPATTWLDLWVGGKGGTAGGADACMNAITGVWSIVINPAAGLATASGGVYGPGGCARQYGNAVAAG